MPDFLEKHGSMFLVLGVVIAGFAALVVIMGQRFDAQQQINGQFVQLVTQRLDAQDELTNERFEQVDRLFDGQDQRLDRLTDAVTDLHRLMVGITERVFRNEGEIDVIREHLGIADTPSP